MNDRVLCRVKTLDDEGHVDEDLGEHVFEERPHIGESFQFVGVIYKTKGFKGFGGRHAFKIVDIYHWPVCSLPDPDQLEYRPAKRPAVCLFVRPGTMMDVD